MPDKCPSCNEKVFHEDGDVEYRCTNADCPAQLQRTLEHFASKSGMDIDGMGPQIISMLCENGMLNSISDIYELKKDKIVKLDRMGEKSADNLIGAIEKSKESSTGFQ